MKKPLLDKQGEAAIDRRGGLAGLKKDACNQRKKWRCKSCLRVLERGDRSQTGWRMKIKDDADFPRTPPKEGGISQGWGLSEDWAKARPHEKARGEGSNWGSNGVKAERTLGKNGLGQNTIRGGPLEVQP